MADAPAGGRAIALRMRLGFETVEAFERGYTRFVTSKGIFLASRSPRPTGTLLRFELQTRAGDRLLVAEGRVVAVRDPDEEKPGRVPGMHVRFTRLTAESQARINRMTAQANRAAEPGVDDDGEAVTLPSADAIAAPSPAPIKTPRARPAPPGEPPMPQPDTSASPFADVFDRLHGGAPTLSVDSFAHAHRADLPTADGLPLEEIPELPPDAVLPR